MHQLLTLWLVGLLSFLAPASKWAPLHILPGWAETVQEREQRYTSIASDLYDVVYDPAEKPLPGTSREETARVLLAIAFHESTYFAKDVDVGPCYRGPGAPGNRCDHGQSVCLMQIYVPPGESRDGYTRAQIEGDRKTCFRVGLHFAQWSYSRCTAPGTRLNAYATGSCKHGSANTQMKLATAARLPRAPEPRDVLAGGP